MVSYQFKVMVAMAAVVFCGYLLVLALQRKNVYFSALAALASCYGIGKAIQFWHLGPMLLRGYLSDIGFVPALIFGAVMIGAKKERTIAFASGALVLALTMEGIQMVFNPFLPKGRFGPRGDWIDVAIFVFSYLVARWLIARIEEKKQKQLRTGKKGLKKITHKKRKR